MRRCFLLLGALLVSPAGAQTSLRAGDEHGLAAVDCVSEIGLARIAEELGDGALAARLSAAAERAPERASELTFDSYQTLLAVRASVHAQQPEALVPALATLACGRDPLLAPEAAFALSRIGERLQPSELAARESLNSDLRRAHDALECARRPPLPRADIAHVLAQVAASLAPMLR
jgi:hypothetical protein